MSESPIDHFNKESPKVRRDILLISRSLLQSIIDYRYETNLQNIDSLAKGKSIRQSRTISLLINNAL